VLLIPGFGFGDHSLSLTAAWLRARGYRPLGARIGINVGCTTELVERLERRLEAHAEATGRRLIVVGQSRGGWLGRVLATKRPELVRGLVMLASPVLDPLGAWTRMPNVWRSAARTPVWASTPTSTPRWSRGSRAGYRAKPGCQAVRNTLGAFPATCGSVG
jgi:pimeloyl-ACP methyl ester carboxylesterase